jgi:hypothetical protein
MQEMGVSNHVVVAVVEKLIKSLMNQIKSLEIVAK